MPEELVKHVLEDIKNDVKEIKIQTKLTNGRVTKLENWRFMLIGAWMTCTVLIIPIALILFKEVVIKTL